MNRKEKQRVKSHKNTKKNNDSKIQKDKEEQKQDNEQLDQSKDSANSQNSNLIQSCSDYSQNCQSSLQIQQTEQQQANILQQQDNAYSNLSSSVYHNNEQLAKTDKTFNANEDQGFNYKSIEIVDKQPEPSSKHNDPILSSYEKVQKEDFNQFSDKIPSFEVLQTTSPIKQIVINPSKEENEQEEQIQYNVEEMGRKPEKNEVVINDQQLITNEEQAINHKQIQDQSAQQPEKLIQQPQSQLQQENLSAQEKYNIEPNSLQFNLDANANKNIIEQEQAEAQKVNKQESAQNVDEIIVDSQVINQNIEEIIDRKPQLVTNEDKAINQEQIPDQSAQHPENNIEAKTQELNDNAENQIKQSELDNVEQDNKQEQAQQQEEEIIVDCQDFVINLEQRELQSKQQNDVMNILKEDDNNLLQNSKDLNTQPVQAAQSPQFEQLQQSDNQIQFDFPQQKEQAPLQQIRPQSEYFIKEPDNQQLETSAMGYHKYSEGNKQDMEDRKSDNSEDHYNNERKPILHQFCSPQINAIDLQSVQDTFLQKTQSLELTKTTSSQSQSLAIRRQINQYLIKRKAFTRIGRLEGQRSNDSADDDDDDAVNENGSGEINDPLEWLRSPENPHNRQHLHSGGPNLYKIKHVNHNNLPQIRITQQHQLTNISTTGRMSDELKKAEQKSYNDNDQRIEEFENLYKISDQLYKQGKYNEAIQHLAVATNIIHPNHFKQDISSFSDCIENQNKGFLLIAKAQFQLKDYYNCLGYLENILHNDKNYDAMKLKFFCYERLNYKKEADEMIREIYNYTEEAGFCDMSMKEKFKEMLLRESEQQKYGRSLQKQKTDNISNSSSSSSIDNIFKYQNNGNGASGSNGNSDEIGGNVYMLKQFKKIVSQRSKLSVLFNIISSGFVTLLGIFAFKKYLLKSVRGSVFWGAILGLIFFLISHKFINTKRIDSKRNSMEDSNHNIKGLQYSQTDNN